MKIVAKLKTLLVSVSIILCGFIQVNHADSISNPIITDAFTADPAALVYNGMVYLYTGHDEASTTDTDYVMDNWKCYSSSDMIHWTDHGEVMQTSVFSWCSGSAFAGQVIEKNGVFYWYAPVWNSDDTGFAIGVAVSNSPTGPFADAIGEPLISSDMTSDISIRWDDIDPTAFIDDDGQAYLYWGNSICRYVKLNSDMISFSGSITNVDVGTSFTEAPWLHKHNGIYYLSYATGWPEKMAYSTSSSPTGPWTFRGILNDYAINSSTNHQSIIDFKGKSYLFYHNGTLPTGGDYRRSVCLQEISYNSDGTINGIETQDNSQISNVYRIQSYNYNTYSFRHKNFDALLVDEDGADPIGDSQWKIVSGLADSGGISFESVTWPGYFLRHVDFDFELAQNDDSDLFKQDATFKTVSGLADSSLTSFESINYSGYYIRHFDFKLRLEERDNSNIFDQDATFTMVRQ